MLHVIGVDLCGTWLCGRPPRAALPILDGVISSSDMNAKDFHELTRRPPDAYKLKDAASYNASVTPFDALTEQLHAPLAQRVLDLAQVDRSDYVLDLGTGTGLVALRAARLAGHGRVVGIDHAQQMLARAAAKARNLGVGPVVHFLQMDAENLGFVSESFDRVVSLFLLLHLPDPLRGVREMYRVLRPSGRVVIAVGSGPKWISWKGAVHGVGQVKQTLLSATGRLLTAPRFLEEMMAKHGIVADETHKPPQIPVRPGRLLREAGFQQIRSYWQGERVECDPDEFWRLQTTYASPLRIRLMDVPSLRLDALREDFLNRCRNVQASKGKLLYQYGAMFFVAERLAVTGFRRAVQVC